MIIFLSLRQGILISGCLLSVGHLAVGFVNEGLDSIPFGRDRFNELMEFRGGNVSSSFLLF